MAGSRVTTRKKRGLFNRKPPELRKYSYINFLMLLKVLGFLLLIETAFMLIPMVVSFILHEKVAVDFLYAALVTLVTGVGLVNIRPRNRDMRKREAILLTGLTWIIMSLFGMLPFLMSGTHLSVTDAFFETISGFTTTGASVLATLEGVPKGILLWRCVVQWIGGMGIILFTLAVVPMLNYQGGIQLFNAEVTGITHDKLRPRVSSTAKSLWMIYLALTTLLIVFLCFSDMDFFDAVCYGLSTMSTGGFATSDMSQVVGTSLYIKIVATVFMFLGGVNFALIYKMIHGEFRTTLRNDTFKWYLGIVAVCYVLLCINIVINHEARSVKDLTISPLFQAVSILSSTGLTEPNFKDWGALATVVMTLMMFVGACAGSTSGGAKIDRVIVMIKFLKNEFYKLMHPNAVTTISMNGKGTPTTLVAKVLGFLFLYVAVIFMGGTVLILLGMPLADSFFCALSCISNTGLGTEATGIGGNYMMVPDAGKWVLSLIMLIGRLELYTILLWFMPVFWKK